MNREEEAEVGRIMHVQHDEPWENNQQNAAIDYAAVHEEQRHRHLRAQLEEAEARLADQIGEREGPQTTEVTEEDVERQRHLTEQLREQIEETAIVTGGGVNLDPNGHRITATNINAQGLIAENPIGNITVPWINTNPMTLNLVNNRRYKINFSKVNSIKDISSILELITNHFNMHFSEDDIEQSNLQNLVTRVDDLD
jgi:hypothetical protein